MMQLSCSWHVIPTGPISARGLLIPFLQSLVQQQQAVSSRADPSKEPQTANSRDSQTRCARRRAASSGRVLRGIVRLSVRVRPV